MKSSACYVAHCFFITLCAALALAWNSTALCQSPEISVAGPDGSQLVSGTAAVSFGASEVGVGAGLNFSILNSGPEPLTGVVVTVEGDLPADFVVSQAPGETVNGNAFTNFTVQFTPAEPGLQTAVLHIASNDPDENPFDIRLSGIGLDPDSQAIWTKYTLPESGLWIEGTPGAVVTASGDTIVARKMSGESGYATLLEKRSGVSGDLVASETIPDFDCRSMILTPEGNVLLAGQTYSTGQGMNLFTVHKRSSSTLGAVWHFDRDGPATDSSDDDDAKGLAIDADGKVIVVGTSEEVDGRQGIVVKIDNILGTQIGAPYLGGMRSDFLTVATSPSGGVFVGGITENAPSLTVSMRRLNSTLTAVNWLDEIVSENTDLRPPGYHKIVTDAAGNVLACGHTEDRPGYLGRLFVRKWNGGTGQVLWSHVRNTNTEEEIGGQGYDLAVDGNGDVAVAGGLFEWDGSESLTFVSYTAKLAGTNGVVVWEKKYLGPAGGGAVAAQLVLEPISNHILVGGAMSSAVVLLRYASLDGTMLGEIIQPLSPIYDQGSYLRLLQGPDGALFVAATSSTETAGYGITMKYAAFSSPTPLQTLPATEVTATTARLNGEITPGAVDFTMEFEWSLDPIVAPRPPTDPFSNTSSATPPIVYAYGSATPIFVDLAGLQPHTTYHFRARANNLPTAVWGQNLTFTTANRNPVAAPDIVAVRFESSIMVSPLGNDSEADNDPITLTGFNQPVHGSVVRSGNTFTYTAQTGFLGTDSFTYTIEDDFGGSSEGLVTVNVQQTYSSWLQTQNLTGLNAQAGSDPNNDGISNIQAFLHGIPAEGVAVHELWGRLPEPGRLNAPGAPPCFTYTYYRSATAEVDVAYLASESLTTGWAPIVPQNTTILWSDPVSGDRIIRLEFCPTEENKSFFIRMALSAP